MNHDNRNHISKLINEWMVCPLYDPSVFVITFMALYIQALYFHSFHNEY